MPWAPDYVTTQQIKDYIGVSDALDDTQLAPLATAASRAVDVSTNRQFGKVTVATARTYRRPPYYSSDAGLWVLDVDDLYDVTGLLVAGVAYASSGAVVLPDNAPADGVPWRQLGWTSEPAYASAGVGSALVVTALWGWLAVPTQVVEACLLQAARWNYRRNSPAGVAGSPDQGSEIRLLQRLDPDVLPVLAGLRRRRRAG